MPVPNPLKNSMQVHIFRYASDLQSACDKLKERLGGTVPITFITTTSTGAIINGDLAPQPGRNIAWLVGHGIATDNKIGTKQRRESALSIDDIINWLHSNNYAYVVDTCCAPDLRRLANKMKLFYYCAPDGKDVSQNQDYNSLDDWWDANGMHLWFNIV